MKHFINKPSGKRKYSLQQSRKHRKLFEIRSIKIHNKLLLPGEWLATPEDTLRPPRCRPGTATCLPCPGTPSWSPSQPTDPPWWTWSARRPSPWRGCWDRWRSGPSTCWWRGRPRGGGWAGMSCSSRPADARTSSAPRDLHIRCEFMCWWVVV